jgi:hypothetical protein
MPTDKSAGFDDRQGLFSRKETAQGDHREFGSRCWPAPSQFPFLVESELSSQEQVLYDDLRARAKPNTNQVSKNSQSDYDYGTETDLLLLAEADVSNTLPQIFQPDAISPEDKPSAADADFVSAST